MQQFELFNVDSGKSLKMTEKEAKKAFGAREWKEMVKGYLPNWVVVEA